MCQGTYIFVQFVACWCHGSIPAEAQPVVVYLGELLSSGQVFKPKSQSPSPRSQQRPEATAEEEVPPVPEAIPDAGRHLVRQRCMALESLKTP